MILELEYLIGYRFLNYCRKVDATLVLPDGRQLKGLLREGPLFTPKNSFFGRNQRTAGVYVIFGSNTRFLYVGSSSDIAHRIAVHRSTLRAQRNKNQPLQRLYSSAEETSFDVKMFNIEDRELAYDVEEMLMALARPSGKLLNLAIDSRTPKGVRHSAETRLHLSKMATGRIHSEATKAKLRAINTGLSEATLKKIKAANSERWKDANFRAYWELKRLRAVIVEGTIYKSLTAAGNAYGVTAGRVRSRILSSNPKFAEWRYQQMSTSHCPRSDPSIPGDLH